VTPPEPSHVLALDLGSSSVRGVVFDAELRPGPVARRAAALHQDPTGAATFDPDRYLDALAACLDDLQAAGQLRGVRVVAASCQWHSLVPLDAAGRPLGPGLSWMDTRAVAPVPGPADPKAFHERTGAWWHGLYWPVRITWLRSQGVRAARWSGLGEYLATRLLGTAAASVSSASGSGALDTTCGQWDPEALDLAGVTAGQLPPVAPDDWRGRLVSGYAHRWPDLAGAQWALPVGDGAVSALGSGCAGPQRLSVTVGTSAAVRLVTPGAPAAADRVWRYRLDRAHSVLGVAYSGGGVLHDWVVRLVAGDPGEAALAALVPGQHGLVSLPYHAGHRAPLPAAGTGTLHGLRLSTTGVDVVAATLEGVCHELAAGARLVDPPGAAEAVLSGGAVAASPWLSRRLAAALGGRARRCLDPEVGARGAAMLATGVRRLPPAELVEASRAEVTAMAAAGQRHRELRERLTGTP
jgi:gluconokinase